MPIPQAGAPAQQGWPVTVLETMDAGGYTYVRVSVEAETEETEAWLAGPQTVLTVGDALVIGDALPMEDFTSTSLNRTFELLYFVSSFEKPNMALPDPGQGTDSGVTGGPQSTALEVLTGGGYTYVRVDVEGDDLWLAGPRVAVSEGQTVSWRGGAPMDGFKSSSLGRSFEKILFVDGISVIR